MTFCGDAPIKAAERLEVQLDGMSIPISIRDLAEWGKLTEKSNSELTYWINLLDIQSKAGLEDLLKAPLLKDRSMGRQFLRSWVGRQLMDEVSDLIRLDSDRSGQRVLNTLERLLKNQSEVTTIDLLEELPAETIYLDLDGLLEVASRWRGKLLKQKRLVKKFSEIESKSSSFEKNQNISLKESHSISEIQPLQVVHRIKPLLLEFWLPVSESIKRTNWIIFMPGLGGSQDHFRWLARQLSAKGWPVVILEHPGSDDKAISELLEGKSSVPGAEVLPERLNDLFSVIRAKNQKRIDVSGEKVVLLGHSLGSLTAFLASGAIPEEGLINRCKNALKDFSITNLSQLLQCQLVDVKIGKQEKIPSLSAIIGINSFGSLLWPQNGDADVDVPVFLAGGTLDLITPPLKEQLGLLISTKSNALSRVLVVEGASHFSPVRVEGQAQEDNGDDVFQLDAAIVGVKPLVVQKIYAREIIRFLEGLEASEQLGSSEHTNYGDIRSHLLDRKAINNLLKNLKTYPGIN